MSTEERNNNNNINRNGNNSGGWKPPPTPFPFSHDFSDTMSVNQNIPFDNRTFGGGNEIDIFSNPGMPNLNVDINNNMNNNINNMNNMNSMNSMNNMNMFGRSSSIITTVTDYPNMGLNYSNFDTNSTIGFDFSGFGRSDSINPISTSTASITPAIPSTSINSCSLNSINNNTMNNNVKINSQRDLCQEYPSIAIQDSKYNNIDSNINVNPFGEPLSTIHETKDVYITPESTPLATPCATPCTPITPPLQKSRSKHNYSSNTNLISNKTTRQPKLDTSRSFRMTTPNIPNTINNTNTNTRTTTTMCNNNRHLFSNPNINDQNVDSSNTSPNTRNHINNKLSNINNNNSINNSNNSNNEQQLFQSLNNNGTSLPAASRNKNSITGCFSSHGHIHQNNNNNNNKQHSHFLRRARSDSFCTHTSNSTNTTVLSPQTKNDNHLIRRCCFRNLNQDYNKDNKHINSVCQHTRFTSRTRETEEDNSDLSDSSSDQPILKRYNTNKQNHLSSLPLSFAVKFAFFVFYTHFGQNFNLLYGNEYACGILSLKKKKKWFVVLCLYGICVSLFDDFS